MELFLLAFLHVLPHPNGEQDGRSWDCQQGQALVDQDPAEDGHCCRNDESRTVMQERLDHPAFDPKLLGIMGACWLKGPGFSWCSYHVTIGSKLAFSCLATSSQRD